MAAGLAVASHAAHEVAHKAQEVSNAVGSFAPGQLEFMQEGEGCGGAAGIFSFAMSSKKRATIAQRLVNPHGMRDTWSGANKLRIPMNDTVTCVTFSRNGSMFASASAAGEVVVYEHLHGKPIMEVQLNVKVSGLAFFTQPVGNTQSTKLAVGKRDGTVSWFSVGDGCQKHPKECLRLVTMGGQAINSLEIGGSRLAVCGNYHYSAPSRGGGLVTACLVCLQESRFGRLCTAPSADLPPSRCGSCRLLHGNDQGRGG